MSKKQSAKKFNLLRIIISVVIFAVIVGAVLLVAVNIRNLSLDAMGKTLRDWFGVGARTESFDYEDKEPTAFAVMSDGLIAASKTGFIVFDKWGNKLVDRDVVMKQPVVISNGTIVGIYDCGGYTLFISDDNGNVSSIELENKLISASVNEKGWFAVCTEEDNYKGSVTVFNNDRDAVYKLYSGDGYILSGELSADSEKLLAVKLSSTGTDVVEYRLDSEAEQLRISLPSQVAVECEYGGYGNISILTEAGFYVYNSDGMLINSYDFSDYDLDGFSLEADGFSVICCGAALVDTRSYLAALDDLGNVIARQETAKTIVDISASNQYIAVLYTDGLVIYNKNLQEKKNCEITSGANRVLMCSDGTAIVTSEYSAEALG